MKRLFLLLLVLTVGSCTTQNIDPAIPDGALYQITVNGKIQSSYEYANGLLALESLYGSCDTPYSISRYNYKSGKIHSAESSVRGIYSSLSTALCDPKGAYDKSTRNFEYDAQGRVTKLLLVHTSVEYTYTPDEVVKHYLENGQPTSRVHYLKYDDQANLIEERTPDPVHGGVVRYEYDSHPNPLQLLEGVYAGSPFQGPHNVVKAFDVDGNLLWHRKFTYNDKGLPSHCDEGNGAVYVYHYK